MTRTKPAVKSPVIRHQEWLPGQIHLFEMDGSKPGVKWVQEVDLEDFKCECSCPDFQIRHAKHNPLISDASHICKHLHSAAAWLIQEGFVTERDLELAALVEGLNPCLKCFMPDADVMVYDEQGRYQTGFMCAQCVAGLRAQNEKWSEGALIIQSEIEMLESRRDALKAEDAQWPGQTSTYELRQLNEQLMDLWREYMAHEPRKLD
jgi:hypothetical protein